MDTSRREILKLSEALVLCQRELAQVREAQEPLQEQCSRLRREREAATAVADQLAQSLAKHLSGKFWNDRQPLARIGWGRFVGSRWPWLKQLFGTRLSVTTANELAQIRQIEASSLFDAGWYLQQNPDVAEAGISPASHFSHAGAKEGRNPGPRFDTTAYLAEHPELVASGVNPLLHAMSSGQA